MRKLFIIIFSCFLISCSQKAYHIAYASYRDNNYDLYLMNGDTSRIQRLTKTPVTEYNISWAPDGKRLYYTVYNKSNREIKAFDFRTHTEFVIINDSTIRSIADVSPDGKQLLIATVDDHPKGELYLYNLETKIKTRITNNHWVESGAKFSPKGNVIVASIQTTLADSTNRSGNAEIFLFDLINNSFYPLTNMKGFSALPSFSPNGKLISFHSCIKNTCDIYLINADGTNLRNLTERTTDSRWPRWTPDGKWIAYTRSTNNNSDIYFISPTSKQVKPVLTSSFKEEIAEINPVKKKLNR